MQESSNVLRTINMCRTSLLPLLGNEVQIKRDLNSQLLSHLRLLKMLFQLLLVFFSLLFVWFVLYDGDCKLLRVTSFFLYLFFLSLIGVTWMWLVLFFIFREMP